MFKKFIQPVALLAVGIVTGLAIETFLSPFGTHGHNPPAGLAGASATSAAPAAALPADAPALSERLLAAIRENDASAAAALIDVPRLIREMERQEIMGALTPPDRLSLAVAVQTSIGSGFVQEGQSGAWKNCTIHRAEPLAGGNEQLVVARMTTRDGGPAGTLRLWMIKGPDGWRLYDWEDVDRIFRTSTNLAATLAGTRKDVEGKYVQAILTAARYTGEGKDDVAERVPGGTETLSRACRPGWRQKLTGVPKRGPYLDSPEFSSGVGCILANPAAILRIGNRLEPNRMRPNEELNETARQWLLPYSRNKAGTALPDASGFTFFGPI